MSLSLIRTQKIGLAGLRRVFCVVQAFGQSMAVSIREIFFLCGAILSSRGILLTFAWVRVLLEGISRVTNLEVAILKSQPLLSKR